MEDSYITAEQADEYYKEHVKLTCYVVVEYDWESQVNLCAFVNKDVAEYHAEAKKYEKLQAGYKPSSVWDIGVEELELVG